MSMLGMEGPYDFNNQTINDMVKRKSPGNYALGNVKADGYYVGYVGRSDTDLNQEMKAKKLIFQNEFSAFKFSYATSPKAAFEKECRNYHDFDPPANKIHPAKPKQTSWECPVCDIFDDK